MTPFEAMQHAVDIVNGSEHPTNKIASCLFNDDDFVTSTNYRHQPLIDNFPLGEKLGSSSQYIHSEIGCTFKAPFHVTGASLCITDPMCPNCAKAIASLCIKHVYIDHKGMEKDFIKRRGNDFETMSLLMMDRACIGVSIIHRKDKKLETILPEKNIKIQVMDDSGDYAESEELKIYSGFSPNITDDDVKECQSHKYSFHIDPLNRLLFELSKKNIKTQSVTCSNHPSSRALVNAVGFGIEEITILSSTLHHGEQGRDTAKALEKNGILKINRVY